MAVFQDLDSVIRALDLAILRIDKEEPSDLQNFRTGKRPIGFGGQYGCTCEFLSSILRDFPMGVWYPLVQFAENKLYTNIQIVDQIRTLCEPFFPYLRYLGFTEMSDLFDALLDLSPSAEREALVQVTHSFLRYLNRYASYAVFHFDWKGLGDRRLFDPSLATAPEIDLSRRVHIRTDNAQRIRMSWDKLGIVVHGHLATHENPELTAAFASCLPFEALHIHALVSGESTYASAPLVTTARIRVKERQCDAPVGRLRFSKATGMKLIMQYGEVTENVPTPVLGEISPEYHPLLLRVGKRLWEATYETKEEIKVRVELV